MIWNELLAVKVYRDRFGTNLLDFTKTARTKLVKCMKNLNMIGFVIITWHLFSSYSFWINLLFILWFHLIFHCLKVVLLPYPGYKLMVPDLTTRACEYCWWFSSGLGKFLWFGPSLKLDHCNFSAINTLRSRQNKRHFTDDIFNGIFANEIFLIPIKKFSEACS